MSDPLQQCLIALQESIGDSIPLIIGGGYGLYLRQSLSVRFTSPTLIPLEALPENRTTQDIDLILRAEVVVSADRMRTMRHALDQLGFRPVAGSEYLQFEKAVHPAGAVKIDLLVGPLGDLFDASLVKRDDRRIRPRAFGELHAHPLEEAIAVEEHLLAVTLGGTAATDGSAIVYIPQPFTYLLMKLFAFRDRLDDQRKDLARHHALDVYRIVGLITPEEDKIVRLLASRYREHPKVIEARRVAQVHFSEPRALGILRMREHPLFSPRMDLEVLRRELALILPPV